MGKKYYCEYCDKSMVATIVKTHNKGVVHQKTVSEHYQQFKDPETILEEESHKKPCLKVLKGECLFGGICRFSHYTREELNALAQYVASKNMKKTETQQPSFQDLYQKLQDEKTQNESSDQKNTILYDTNGLAHILPWTYNALVLNNNESLPPSIQQMKIEDFSNMTLTEWG